MGDSINALLVVFPDNYLIYLKRSPTLMIIVDYI